MKVCPVCEMEEEDSALSCSMCGSDFEPSVKEVPEQESRGFRDIFGYSEWV